MLLALISHADCAAHDPGPWHPERAERIAAIADQLLASGADVYCRHYDAPLATKAQLARVHDPAYIDHVFNVAPPHGTVEFDPDTVMSPGTLNAALRAAGAVVYAVERVLSGQHTTAFCNIRPPGHHARPAQAMGFCFFNNIAVGAASALEDFSIKRLAILDFDIHHGNGTEEMLRKDSRVMFCSTFESENYASWLAGASDTQHLNIPLQGMPTGRDLRVAFGEKIFPAVDAFAPELIMISAGFDGHCEDEISRSCFRESDYAWVTQGIKALADRHAQGRIVSVLEGGYSLSALGRCAVAHIRALAGIEQTL